MFMFMYIYVYVYLYIFMHMYMYIAREGPLHSAVFLQNVKKTWAITEY
jgi:hypothetical protein